MHVRVSACVCVCVCQFVSVSVSVSVCLSDLVGLVVRASTSGAEDPGLESRLRRDYSGLSDQ